MNQRTSSPLTSFSSSVPSTSRSLSPEICCPSTSRSLSPEISATADEECITIIEDHQGNHSLFKFQINKFSSRTRAVSSGFQVGRGFGRILVYPVGDSQSKPGYTSIYIQTSMEEKFFSCSISIVNLVEESKSIKKEFWYRPSQDNYSFLGWPDFALTSTLLDPKSGFTPNEVDCIVITVDIFVLKESVEYFPCKSKFLEGEFTWKVHNFSLFKEKIKTQKIMSPYFSATECDLCINIFQTNIDGIDYLSMSLEGKKNDNMYIPDESYWCLFGMNVRNQMRGLKNMHRDSYGRLAIDSRSGESGDNACLGWNDYMKMGDFVRPDLGYIVNDTAVFQVSFYILKESSDFKGGSLEERNMGKEKKFDEYIGQFSWNIDNFTKLRNFSRNRGLYGLYVKSKRFQIGDRDCRLIVDLYPRSSRPPYHLPLFLEVTASRDISDDCGCFVSHQLSVVNQWREDKSIVKEAHNHYSKAANGWGWQNFVTFELFDQDAGFRVHDSVIFNAKVLILKETYEIQDLELNNAAGQTEVVGGAKKSFKWKLENFLSFKEIMETHKIFSNFFQVGGFELRIGVHVSFGTFYMYLESDQSACIDPNKNFYVKYKMGVVNQMNSDKTIWKEYTMYTNTWHKSVLPFMKESDMLEEDAGFLLGDTIVFVCYIMNYFPKSMGVGIGTSFADPRQILHMPGYIWVADDYGSSSQASPVHQGPKRTAASRETSTYVVQAEDTLKEGDMDGTSDDNRDSDQQSYLPSSIDEQGASSANHPMVQAMEGIIWEDGPTRGFKLQNTLNVMDNSYSLEDITAHNQPDKAIEDEQNECVLQSFLIEDETPREDESLPFVKCSPLWEIVKSNEIFYAIPQHLHFYPLKQFNEEFREGLAIGLTWSFTNIVEKIRKAKVDDPMCNLQVMLNALKDLKAHGFNAKPIQARLEKLLRIKEEQGQISSQLVEAEEKINEKQHEKVMLETELAEIGMEMRRMHECLDEMKKKWNAVEVKNENQGSEIAELKTTMNRLGERFQRARLEFNRVVTDPW